MNRKNTWIALGALVLAGIAATLLAIGESANSETDLPAIAGDGLGNEADDEPLDDWLGSDDTEERPRVRSRRPRSASSENMSMPRDGNRRSGSQERGPLARRRATRMRERLLEGIEIVPLGPSATTLEGDDVVDALRDARRSTRECAREAGLDREVWRGARGVERELVFDVAPDGTVVPGSFTASPPFPQGLDRCFAQGFESTTVAPTGSEGARVSVQMPTSRRGDGGPARTRSDGGR